MSPPALLAEARRVLDQALVGPASSRASVFLVRRALEAAVLARVGATLDVDGVPFRVVLLCLRRTHADRRVAERAAAAWNGLSRACHAYGYELPPPESLVRAWIAEVDGVLASMSWA